MLVKSLKNCDFVGNLTNIIKNSSNHSFFFENLLLEGRMEPSRGPHVACGPRVLGAWVRQFRALLVRSQHSKEC
jgi:hypothetical protein